jgi:hypothetical protein
MRWEKMGLLFSALGQQPWMVSHAANPTVDLLGGDLIRVYFGTRDCGNRSHIGAAVFELRDIVRLIDLTSSPLIAPGEPGTFDDSGTSMGCVVRSSDALYLYYLGWNLGVTVPWRNSIGLAISTDNGLSFKKHSAAPILDRNAVDPFSLSYPWILREGGCWRMWYGSNLRWGSKQSDMEHVIKYAESEDGRSWRRDGRVMLPLHGPDEYALTRPCVVHDSGIYRMWFTYRGRRNRIGYAESTNGLIWERQDQLGALNVSDGGWDAEMLAYPCVFHCRGTRYMLYNGNDYGKSGFGIAVEC